MKLVTYRRGERTSIGKVVGDQVLDLPASDAGLPSTMMELLAAGSEALKRAQAISPGQGIAYPLAEVRLLAPVPNPRKFLAIGMNYRKHVEEALRAGMKVPEVQIWFNKQVTCVNGPTGDVHMPRVSDQLDYEVELCVVIGQRCRHVSAANARQVIAGYMVCNDVTVRDWQLRSPTMTIGKSFDTSGPTGPWIVTDDEVLDPHALNMRMYINDELRQQESTAGMVYNIYQQIEHLSAAFTLEPGDLIATGTPSGVGIAMQPARFLKVGDVMRAEIDGIGQIENRVVAEPENI
ncbi:fumarylacetoacetate hydrolase family protein [Polaromonas glacialis]|uniref:fumarylacetoacetate hydrolase family protein n=1 Tax=Polaromonas glacialis TaxID=866564 RepID=UPI000497B392|nr:fumarylacetoacetate hydrolase family protein [Polaromonas glacialis]